MRYYFWHQHRHHFFGNLSATLLSSDVPRRLWGLLSHFWFFQLDGADWAQTHKLLGIGANDGMDFADSEGQGSAPLGTAKEWRLISDHTFHARSTHEWLCASFAVRSALAQDLYCRRESFMIDDGKGRCLFRSAHVKKSSEQIGKKCNNVFLSQIVFQKFLYWVIIPLPIIWCQSSTWLTSWSSVRHLISSYK